MPGGRWDAWDAIVAKQDIEPLEVLRVAAMYERYFQEVQNRAVRAARAQGHSWQQIADSVGTTRQTAWQKWKTPAVEQATWSARLGVLDATRQVTDLLAGIGRLVEHGRAAEVDAAEHRAGLAPLVDTWVEPDDPDREALLDAAVAGLARAVEQYATAAAGAPFEVYATWWIRQSVTHSQREHRHP